MVFPARRRRRHLASYYSLDSPLWAPLPTPAKLPGRKLGSRLDGRRRRQVRRVLLGGAAWGRLVLWGCVQQLVGGRLVSIESLWLGSSFTSATLPAAYPLLLAFFGVCGVANVCVLRLVVVLRGWPRLETNHCSSSRVSVSTFDGAAPSSLGEGKGSPSMLEEAGVGSSPAPGFQPLSSTHPLPVADPRGFTCSRFRCLSVVGFSSTSSSSLVIFRLLVVGVAL